MKIYNYNKDTFEYISESEARLDPEESKVQNTEIYILPAYSTFNKPSTTLLENEIHVFNINTNKWIRTKNYRGKIIYNKQNLSLKLITELGDIDESLYTFLNPNEVEYPIWSDSTGCWIINIEQKNEVEKTEKINNAKTLLINSDIIVLRCYENSIEVPAVWVTYRKTLRKIINNIINNIINDNIPVKPDEPDFTD